MSSCIHPVKPCQSLQVGFLCIPVVYGASIYHPNRSPHKPLGSPFWKFQSNQTKHQETNHWTIGWSFNSCLLNCNSTCQYQEYLSEFQIFTHKPPISFEMYHFGGEDSPILHYGFWWKTAWKLVTLLDSSFTHKPCNLRWLHLGLFNVRLVPFPTISPQHHPTSKVVLCSSHSLPQHLWPRWLQNAPPGIERHHHYKEEEMGVAALKTTVKSQQGNCFHISGRRSLDRIPKKTVLMA